MMKEAVRDGLGLLESKIEIITAGLLSHKRVSILFFVLVACSLLSFRFFVCNC